MELIYITSCIIFAIIGYHFGKKKAIGERVGLVLGLFLGFIGILIIACLPNKVDAVITGPYQNQNNNSNKADELKRWFELKESGVITNEEFEEKKRQIIS